MRYFILFLLFSLPLHAQVVRPQSDTATDSELQSLLAKYRPHLYATKEEFTPPCSMEEMMKHSIIVDVRKGKPVLDEAGKPVRATREALEKYNAKHYVMKLTKDYTRLNGEGYRENYDNTKPLVYTEAKRLKSGNISLHYYFFYPGSTSGKVPIAGFLRTHEGDGETATVLIDGKTKKPIGISAGQHYYSESRKWDDVKKGADGRPKLYIAQGSHATYFEPGKYRTMMGEFGYKGWDASRWALKQALDVTAEDIEVDYRLSRYDKQGILSKWKGRWGGLDKDENKSGTRSIDYGPVSFAFKNYDNPLLAPGLNPETAHFFYYQPTKDYRKGSVLLSHLYNTNLKDKMILLIASMGKSRYELEMKLKENPLLLKGISAKKKKALLDFLPAAANYATLRQYHGWLLNLEVDLKALRAKQTDKEAKNQITDELKRVTELEKYLRNFKEQKSKLLLSSLGSNPGESLGILMQDMNATGSGKEQDKLYDLIAKSLNLSSDELRTLLPPKPADTKVSYDFSQMRELFKKKDEKKDIFKKDKKPIRLAKLIRENYLRHKPGRFLSVLGGIGLGSVLGQALIPIPGLGAIIGGIAGGILGRKTAGLFERFFEKEKPKPYIYDESVPTFLPGSYRSDAGEIDTETAVNSSKSFAIGSSASAGIQHYFNDYQKALKAYKETVSTGNQELSKTAFERLTKAKNQYEALLK
ncbi:hypothetical protein ACFL35_03025 [Candidatus Riflebacteria bacterium]